MPSMPGLPPFLLTCRSARNRFPRSSTRSINTLASTGASSFVSPTAVSSHKGSRPTDAVPPFLDKRLLLSFNPLSGHRSGLQRQRVAVRLVCLLRLSARSAPIASPASSPTTPFADFFLAVSANLSALSPFLPHAESQGTRKTSRGKTQNCPCVKIGRASCREREEVWDRAWKED